MAKTCGRPGASSASGAQPAVRRARGNGAAPRQAGVEGQPYEDEEGEDVLAEDPDDVYVEIGCYRFQEGDFTWEQIEVPHAVAAEVERDLRSGHHSYAARDLPNFKLGLATACQSQARQRQNDGGLGFLGLAFGRDAHQHAGRQHKQVCAMQRVQGHKARQRVA